MGEMAREDPPSVSDPPARSPHPHTEQAPRALLPRKAFPGPLRTGKHLSSRSSRRFRKSHKRVPTYDPAAPRPAVPREKGGQDGHRRLTTAQTCKQPKRRREHKLCPRHTVPSAMPRLSQPHAAAPQTPREEAGGTGQAHTQAHDPTCDISEAARLTVTESRSVVAGAGPGKYSVSRAGGDGTSAFPMSGSHCV